MAQEVYHIRLNSGEDLISEVAWPKPKEGHETHIVLKNPMKIVCIPSSKPGFVSLSLMQWVFAKISSEQEFNIYSRDILTMSKPNESLKDYYFDTVKHFSSQFKSNSIYEEDTTTEEFLEELEREIDAVVKSDKVVEESNEDMDNLRDVVNEFLRSLSSNNRGTLH
jgi:hypothetical protein